MWVNESVVIINATLQLLDIYIYIYIQIIIIIKRKFLIKLIIQLNEAFTPSESYFASGKNGNKGHLVSCI